MLSPHASVGAAQTAFYIPAVIAAVWLFRRHERPRMAWFCITLFSLFRVAGGIMLILYTQQPDNVGIIVATILFEGAGVIPLMLALVGLLRIVAAFDLSHSERFRKAILFLRLSFLAGIGLLVAGSALVGNATDANIQQLAYRLIRAGYAVLIVVLGVVAGFDVYLWLRKPKVSGPSQQVLIGITASIPFLAVRMAYACLSSFNTSGGDYWSPLAGSVGALVGMHSLMEYIVVLICLAVGYIIPPITRAGKQGAAMTVGEV